MWQKPRNVTKFKIVTSWCLKMSQNITLCKSVVQRYVYLLCFDPARNGSKYALEKVFQINLFPHHGPSMPFFCGCWFVIPPHSKQLNYVRDAYKWCAVIGKRPAAPNGTPAMDPGHRNIDLTYTFAYYCEEDIRIRRHTNKRWIEQHKCILVLRLDLKKLFMFSLSIMCITITIYFDFSYVSI